MITENLSTLKIHKLTQDQYDRELAAGNIDANALYLTPDEAKNIEIDTTLTQSGMAADAKIVGDTINEVIENKQSKPFYVTIVSNGDATGVSDYTYEEIVDYYSQGIPVYCLLISDSGEILRMPVILEEEEQPKIWGTIDKNSGAMICINFTSEEEVLITTRNEVVFVNVTENEDGTYSMDKTPEEIATAFKNSVLFARKVYGNSERILPIVDGNSEFESYYFEAPSGDRHIFISILGDAVSFGITDNKAKNPYNLIINGISYDGSEEKTVDIPVVHDWAKEPTKPTYTASEVGADASGTANSLINTHNNSSDSHSDIREAINKLSLEKTNKNLLTLGIHTDGLLYIFYNNTPIGNGIEMYQDGDVFGYVDTDNNIIVKGNLDDGTYSVKYEMEDGSIVNIGDLVLDNNIYYSVTNNLTNCTNNNSTVQVVKGGNYSAIISANSGYELSSVTVTMGGTDISSIVSGGNISIENVTGKIVITATATEIFIEPAEPTNFAVPNTTNKTDWSIWCNKARFGSDGGYREASSESHVVTNYIAMEVGDIIRFEGLNVPTTGTSMNDGMHFSDADKTMLSCSYLEFYTNTNYNYLAVTVTDGVYEIDTSGLSKHEKAKNSKFFRISGSLTGTVDDVVIKVKRNGTWL